MRCVGIQTDAAHEPVFVVGRGCRNFHQFRRQLPTEGRQSCMCDRNQVLQSWEVEQCENHATSPRNGDHLKKVEHDSAQESLRRREMFGKFLFVSAKVPRRVLNN